ncbi:hypothetical protein BRD56_05400 [Thermoplasmatales archaeon SW_10_69_26]|nr:MAG: hypothetical protein BRD56_05400 [Thermoplasmatales archaeon SW_10_69_26]
MTVEQDKRKYKRLVELAEGQAGEVARKRTHGHFHGSITALFANAGSNASATIEVYGSNDPNRSQGEGELLESATVLAAGETSLSWADKSYRDVYVDLESIEDLQLDELAIHVSGQDKG